ncbi:hypothetical protein [Litorilituus sediminis]|uniref:Alginate export domain-containing protein n=1 Tax=Litorilituus sediminis TaxID=718192 RepID=A0A4P6P9T0_9GAMM|nr:hypothetical protein [Litorilituus sediminis]QBG36315.1 hypothetical protein EMK97_11620 [Litorilituus sediminis]
MANKTLCLVCALLYSQTCFADNTVFTGYLKSYALGQDSITIDASDGLSEQQAISGNFQSQNALRLMGSYLSPSVGNFELHYELQPLYFSNTDFAKNSGGLGATIATSETQYRYKDFDTVMTEVGNHGVILQNLDRANYQYSHKYGDLTIGRQVVSFGSARFINPTDIFLPFAIQTLNQEYRVGIDAIRFKADVGDFAMIDAGVIIGKDANKANSAAFLRGKNSIAGNDIELMMVALDDAWLVGGGIERAIADFGFWFESAYMSWHQDAQLPTKPSETVQAYTNNYWRASIGSDYAINEDIIAMFEYHYNGAGSANAHNYHQLPQQAPYQKAGVFLLGQHYLIPAVTWLASPLISVSASAFYNLDDHSIFINISSETSWTDNLYSDFGVFLTHGENMQYQSNLAMDNYRFASEFGAYPLSIFASVRYYF